MSSRPPRIDIARWNEAGLAGVIGHDRKTATVLTDAGLPWNVAPMWLRRTAAPAPAAAPTRQPDTPL